MVLDQGGHATRAIVFDAFGRSVCRAEAPIRTITRGELEVEHDPIELMASVYSVIDQVQKTLGEDYFKITKAGLATQRSSIVCWDKKTEQPLSPIISWQDRRTHNDISQYENHAQYIHDVTGLYLNPHYGATKMRWCLNHISSIKDALVSGGLCIAPMASYILFQLLDEKPFVIDPANASRTLMMDYKSLKWDTSLQKLFSIPNNILPDIVLTQYDYGNIVRHGHVIPLAICTGDQSAVIYSEGKLLESEVFVNAGTGAFVLKTSESAPDLENERLLASIAYADVSKVNYVIEGTVNGAGRALRWFAEQSDITDYEHHLDEWCERFDNPPLFINAISGIGSPFWVAEYESNFTKEVSSEEKFVSVLESIVFLISENIKCIQNISGEVLQIRLGGGLAKSLSFCQKLSCVSGCKVVLAQEQEATAKGVFYLLSGDIGEKSGAYSESLNLNNDQVLLTRYSYWHKLMSEKFLR
ncbi:MAG: FGGY family carbohydrate kinase [Gammaproteobacteria bacterium]|nr:FGGY family carbohydrate kinase [Gammaproteobacteria bacterium]